MSEVKEVKEVKEVREVREVKEVKEVKAICFMAKTPAEKLLALTSSDRRER